MDNLTFDDFKLLPKCPGIYCITNIINNKQYVGQSVDLRVRVRRHYWNLIHNRYDRYLYRAMNKYGIENFKISILCTLEKTPDIRQVLNDLEIKYIKELGTFGNGYNETLGGDSLSGHKFSEESKKKMSESQKKSMAKRIAEGTYTPPTCISKTITVYLYNYKTKEYITFDSEKEGAIYLKNIYNTNIESSLISSLVMGKISFLYDYFGAKTKEELEVRISNQTSIHHNSGFGKPTSKEYLEYLKSIVDEEGYLPKLEIVAKHYNRSPQTLSGWNKNIKEYLELDKSKNKLKLVNI